MIKPKNNEKLKSMIVEGVINCNYEDLICDFDINVNASIINAGDITAWDINARDITARHINARDITARHITADDINARDINAYDINYYAVCFAYNYISCASIKGRRKNSKHFCLDGKIIIKEFNS